MTDRRKSPPLFDLMRERERAANAPDPITPAKNPQPTPQSSPPPTTEPKPAPTQRPSQSPTQQSQASPAPSARPVAWDSSGGVSRAERSAAAMLDEAPQTTKTIKVPMSMVYLAVAILLAAVVLAWAGGHHFGELKGKAEMERLINVNPVVRPPNQSPDGSGVAAGNPATTPDPVVQDDPIESTPILRDGINPDAPGMTVMSASGYMRTDPREGATNYLELATLPKEEAASAIEFMNSHGVPVIGIPRLDSRRSDANNPSRYTLYSLGVAAPGDQFRTMTRERDDHQRLIARLGKQWQQAFRGGSDFAVSKTQWVKYTP